MVEPGTQLVEPGTQLVEHDTRHDTIGSILSTSVSSSNHDGVNRTVSILETSGPVAALAANIPF